MKSVSAAPCATLRRAIVLLGMKLAIWSLTAISACRRSVQRWREDPVGLSGGNGLHADRIHLRMHVRQRNVPFVPTQCWSLVPVYGQCSVHELRGRESRHMHLRGWRGQPARRAILRPRLDWLGMLLSLTWQRSTPSRYASGMRNPYAPPSVTRRRTRAQVLRWWALALALAAALIVVGVFAHSAWQVALVWLGKLGLAVVILLGPE